jgi:hypothetical protein
MKVRGCICRGAALGCVDATLSQTHSFALTGADASVSPRRREKGRGDPCSHYVIPTPKITLVFGRPRNDIYKIALNYSQIAQIYSDPVAETPKSEAS